MPEHWKHGNGFAIRYGGFKDIQWFFGDQFQQQNPGLMGCIPPVHPAAIAIEAAKVAAMFLQWWEMRKQTLLQTAQFEERRLGWIADMLAQWYQEVHSGTLRLDTIRYLDRELTRFLDKAVVSKLVDAPSTLLLQIERSSQLLVQLNLVTNSLLQDALAKQTPNFVMGEQRPPVFHYRPFTETDRDETLLQKYLEEIQTHLTGNRVEQDNAIKFGGVVEVLQITAFGSLFWTFKRLYDLKVEMEKAGRLQDFLPIRHFCIELRSSHLLLRELQSVAANFLKYDGPILVARSLR